MRLKKLKINSFLPFLLISITIHLTAQKPDVVFKDVTKKTGIDFRYTFGDYNYENIVESSGSGVTVFDYNNDGLMDLYMMNGTYLYGVSDDGGLGFRETNDKLYKNNGNGTFTDVSASAGVNDTTWSMAAGAIDYDNDGDEDLYLLNYGPNIFYRNNGNGTFADITDRLGLRGPDKLSGFLKWSIGVSFWDHNLDGRLDAMVGNFLAFDPAYVSPVTPGLMPHPSEYKGQASMLYEQQPDGTFIDVTEKKNLLYPDSKCMGLTIFDYDYDGDIDIFQANDHQLNFMFRNDKGIYKEVGVQIGVAANNNGKGTGSMHGTIGDVDGDGLIDILVVDLEHGALYRNLGNGLFEDITQSSGVQGPLAGKGSWASALFDYDNDGDLDIVSANGIAEELILSYPLLLENDGKGHFKDTGKEHGTYFRVKRSGRGMAVWDYDNDGDMDIIISHVDLKATAALLRNDGGNSNHWLGLTLKGQNGPVPAISARVEVTAGGKRHVHINQWATGYLSNNDPRLHIGLGQATRVDQLEIFWSDGKKETYRDIAADRYIIMTQGKGITTK
ncbi:MAG: CRTAC1 family protein [Bacteroidota bacterium]